MGWKASAIIIHKPVKIEYEALLEKLGFSSLRTIADEPFEVAINPPKNKVYVGFYKDNLLICAADLPMHFFETHTTQTERVFGETFPDSEVCSIVLHSTVNLWGYAVTKNGQKVRARAGTADDGTVLEIGLPLDEEKELLSKSKVDEKGIRTYLLDEFPDELFDEDQVGENFVFAICKRYFGQELNQADDLLFETTLRGYSFGRLISQTKIPEQTAIDRSPQIKQMNKPWWKFW